MVDDQQPENPGESAADKPAEPVADASAQAAGAPKGDGQPKGEGDPEGEGEQPTPAAGDETAVVLPVAAKPAEPADQPAKAAESGKPAKSAWRGRAGVRPAMLNEPDPAADWAAPRPPGRAWWLPVVLGIVALVVVVGVVYVVVSRSTRHDDTPPAAAPSSTSPSPSPSAATVFQPTTGVSVPPSSGFSLPSESASTPVLPTLITPTGLVQVPDVTQLFVTDAQNELSAYGLASTLKAEVTTTYMPNVVIAMDPPAGTSVPAGHVITLTYAVSPTPSTTAASPSTSPTP